MSVLDTDTGTTRRYHHGDLAEAMVSRALADVRARGADHLSLRAVAQAVGVSASAAYNHFADKDALLCAVGACGIADMDERMARALAAHPGTDADSAWRRLEGLGRAYLTFAVDEPHLFRLAFGPPCMSVRQQTHDSGPYGKLVDALDELHARGLLRPGVRPGLDVTIWAATHGTASLIVEGGLPADAGEALFDSVRRLVLDTEGRR